MSFFCLPFLSLKKKKKQCHSCVPLSVPLFSNIFSFLAPCESFCIRCTCKKWLQYYECHFYKTPLRQLVIKTSLACLPSFHDAFASFIETERELLCFGSFGVEVPLPQIKMSVYNMEKGYQKIGPLCDLFIEPPRFHTGDQHTYIQFPDENDQIILYQFTVSPNGKTCGWVRKYPILEVKEFWLLHYCVEETHIALSTLQRIYIQDLQTQQSFSFPHKLNNMRPLLALDTKNQYVYVGDDEFTIKMNWQGQIVALLPKMVTFLYSNKWNVLMGITGTWKDRLFQVFTSKSQLYYWTKLPFEQKTGCLLGMDLVGDHVNVKYSIKYMKTMGNPCVYGYKKYVFKIHCLT